jgi:hypothetical protein
MERELDSKTLITRSNMKASAPERPIRKIQVSIAQVTAYFAAAKLFPFLSASFTVA